MLLNKESIKRIDEIAYSIYSVPIFDQSCDSSDCNRERAY